jgi:hypothetical protein
LTLDTYEGLALYDVDDLIATMFFLRASIGAWCNSHDGGLALGGAL